MKNNALYLTTSIQKRVATLNYKTNVKQGNPSNQNFHSRLINILSSYFNMNIVSYRSYAKEKYPYHNDENYHYSECSNSLFYKLIFNEKNIYNLASSLMNDINYIFVDSMNIKLLKSAIKLKEKYNVKLIAIVTDNPENLSDVPNTYINKWKELIINADAYIVVMEELKKLLPYKPCVVINALLPNYKNIKPHKEMKPYIYFAGALYSRYGVDTLIEAYKKSSINEKYNLIIAGHGELVNNIKKDEKIIYINQVDEDTNLSYILGASLLINPRPYNDKLDKESIPSKMIEYILSNRPIISTKHSLLLDMLGDNIYWINDDLNGLLKGFNAFLKGKIPLENDAAAIIKKEFNNKKILNKIISLLKN